MAYKILGVKQKSRTQPATMPPKAKKSPAFTPVEVGILLEEVSQFQGVLFGGTHTPDHLSRKIALWKSIIETMAPSSPCPRTFEQVRKKWQDLSCAVKKKVATIRREAKQTGGGPEDKTTLNPDEEKVVAILSKEALEGVEGGVDMMGGMGSCP